MNNIDFEKDQQEVIQKTDNIKTLADQVEKLNSLQQRIELQEDNLKNTKKEFDYLSGEVIPTMMAEMGLSHLKLMDSRCRCVHVCHLHPLPAPVESLQHEAGLHMHHRLVRDRAVH